MKQLLIFTVSLLLFSGMNAQTTELWSITAYGGLDNAGVIFKTDGSGNNQTIVRSFKFDYSGGYPIYTKLCETSNGKLYGMTSQGGAYDYGVLFEYDSATNTYTNKVDFDRINKGSNPIGSVIQADNGNLYGMTYGGGANDCGVIFEYDPATNTYTTKFDFDDTNTGHNPQGSLIQADNGKLYGMTLYGGANGKGVLFEFDPTTNVYSKKLDFDGNNGAMPYGSLIQANNGKIYGMTLYGGTNNFGILFEFDPATDIYTKKLDLDSNNTGSNPYGSLMQADNGKLYGMTSQGGAYDYGVLFEFDPATDTFTKKLDFDGSSNGSHPYGSLMQANNGKLYGLISGGGANNYGILFEFDPNTDTYTKKLDFDGTNGRSPFGSLMQDSNGKFYGTTTYGGAIDNGVLFEYDLVADTLIKKLDFYLANKGVYPRGSLTQADNGKLYGLAYLGGTNGGFGTIFEYDPVTDTLINKLNFDGTNGAGPQGSLVQANNGKLYGMTSQGGAYDYGVLFEFDPATDTFTKKLDFDGVNKGSKPYGNLLQTSNGKLYGMTSEGGTHDYGTLFEYDLSTDTYTKKIDFDYYNGAAPLGSLIQASSGKLYGMAEFGGANDDGVLFEYDLTTDTYTVELNFDGTNNGAWPEGTLTQTSNGKLYGITYGGGTNDKGVLFEYDPNTDTYIKKLDFNGTNNGALPKGTLIQASNGKLYGITSSGGINNKGVLFEYDPTTNTYTKKVDFDGTNGSGPFYTRLIEITTTKINENKIFNNVLIYPNPTNGTVNVNLGNLQTVSLKVFDVTGNVIYSDSNVKTKLYQFNLNKPAGFYIIEITTNNQTQKFKLVVE